KPASFRPWRNAVMRSVLSVSAPLPRNPITGIAACCALAASGHATAPPSSVMNSRRLIVAPRGQNHAPHRLTAVRVLERGEGDANCDQLFWAGNVGSGPHDRVKTGKAQNRQMFSGLHPKAAVQQTPMDVSQVPGAAVSICSITHACLARIRRRAQTSPVGTIAAVSTIRMTVFSGGSRAPRERVFALRPFFSPYRQHSASAARSEPSPIDAVVLNEPVSDFHHFDE